MFTKAEIELLLRRARVRQPEVEPSAPAPHVEPFDFQERRRLSPAQMNRIVDSHTAYATQLERSLTSLIGSDCKVNVAGAEIITYGSFLSQFPDGTVYQTLEMEASEGGLFVQMDLGTVLAMIDLMLGGDGATVETTRPLTPVEHELFEPIVETVGAALQALWAPFINTRVRPKHIIAATNLLPADQEVVIIKFDAQAGEVHGMWIVVVPPIVSSALSLKIDQELSAVKSNQTDQNRHRMREKLLDSCFTLELFLPSSVVAVRKVAHLKVGQVVVLKPRSIDPIHFNIAGVSFFQASPVSCGTRRGAQIRKTLSIVKTEEKEAG